MRRERAICLFLLLSTLAVYWRITGNAFTNFDDPDYVTDNPMVLRGLTWEGVKWAFTTQHAGNWHPLTWLSLMLDCQLFGQRASLHHLENVFWHALNAVLLFGFLNRATGAVWRSAMVAALFAWHPLHVESVAWVAERKDVLSTFFGLLALHAYLAYVKRPALSLYALMTTAFVLSLLAKAMLVTFPFLLLLLDYWPLRRMTITNRKAEGDALPPAAGAESVPAKKLVLEKLPLLLISAVISAVTFVVQAKGGAVVGMKVFPVFTRVTLAVISYRAYLFKMIWPRRLAAFYPCPPYLKLGDGLVSLAVILIITAAVLWRMRSRPYLFTGWFWYLGTLVPVIGLVQVGGQMMADRYTYIPMIGVSVAVVWRLADIFAGWKAGKPVAIVCSALVLAGCLAKTYAQIGYWKDSVTLHEHALALGLSSPTTYYNLGHAYSLRADFSNAIPQFEEAIRLNPKYAEAYANLGSCYNLQGDTTRAIELYRTALNIKPNLEQTHFGLATALAQEGLFTEAREHFLEALRLKPDFTEAHVKLGNLLMNMGKRDQAIDQYQAALEQDPNHFEAHFCLAGTFARERAFDEAVKEYRAAIKLKANDVSALNDLAWILSTEDGPNIHKPTEAINLAERACRLTKFQEAGYLDTLAAAYSEAGRFPEAIETTRKAVAAAQAAGKPQLAATIESRLKYYEAHTAYRAMMKSLAASGTK